MIPSPTIAAESVPPTSAPMGAAAAGRQSTAPSGSTAALLDALHDALGSERRLLEDLIAQMRQQRSAVGSEDIDSVDESVFSTHRILATLGQARQRRRRINELLGGAADMSLRDLEGLLGEAVPPRLREARVRLQTVAEMLSREVGMNRKLLREALARNEAFVRTLAGDAAADATYAAAPTAAPGAPAAATPPAARPTPTRGIILNRTA